MSPGSLSSILEFTHCFPETSCISGSLRSLIYEFPNLSELEAIFPHLVLADQAFELKTEIFLLLVLTTTVGTENRASLTCATLVVTMVFVSALLLSTLQSNARRILVLPTTLRLSIWLVASRAEAPKIYIIWWFESPQSFVLIVQV